MFRNYLLLAGMLGLQFFFAIASAQESAQKATVNSPQIWQSENGSFLLSYESQLNPIKINQIHSWNLHLTDAQGQPVSNAEITIKGGMPEHNHGLATLPSVAESSNGNYFLQGLRFHMMGYWELELEITQGAINDKVVITLDL